MTFQFIRDRVARIRVHADTGDYEAAHGEEDDLWRDVLRAIADGADNPRAMAREALETTHIDFERYTA
jgi:hypothetical protein